MNPLIRLFRSRIYTAVWLLTLLLVIGVIGYKLMLNITWVDAVYMTVITITTVGYGEVVPLEPEAKIFTVFLILTSVIIVGYAIKIITEYILSKNDLDELKQKKMQKEIDKLNDHIIVCGYGRNGKQAVKKLLAHDKKFVVVEMDKEVADRYKSALIPMIIGNANEDEVLKQAGIERADIMISALPSDADNLFAVLSARQLNKDLKIISRASEETSYNKLKLAGANNVILPDKIGGDHMASLVVVPDLVEFIDNLGIVGKKNINIEEVPVDKLYNAQESKSIRELDLRQKTGCTVIGFKGPDGDYLVNPGADVVLVPESKIIVLGRPEQIQNLNSTYNL
ncbi:MAG: NAD-binding protein [Bacteroidia bacterium]|nr:NAD-binding protein [Bacteroidia bacterium]MBT8309008.1 NAD-binding protein [Bacteroidia bacterium]NNK28997.1 potassium channel protein [Flavobacteriaceae bacterium]NNL61662.1 potassium channel protein [Flavobacteriaceae bacterium]